MQGGHRTLSLIADVATIDIGGRQWNSLYAVDETAVYAVRQQKHVLYRTASLLAGPSSEAIFCLGNTSGGNQHPISLTELFARQPTITEISLRDPAIKEMDGIFCSETGQRENFPTGIGQDGNFPAGTGQHGNFLAGTGQHSNFPTETSHYGNS